MDATVLITGESGTGKEMFAQSIHNLSGRKNGPFVAVNCATIPENLLESELFGYEEGAFTGARKKGIAGLFTVAHKGTIFLDEITEMSPSLQARLLRIIQEKEVIPLGSEKIIPIDIRVIAATNKDLTAEVKNENFRRDLYFRLNILNLKIPPLIARNGDFRRDDDALLGCDGQGGARNHHARRGLPRREKGRGRLSVATVVIDYDLSGGSGHAGHVTPTGRRPNLWKS